MMGYDSDEDVDSGDDDDDGDDDNADEDCILRETNIYLHTIHI